MISTYHEEPDHTLQDVVHDEMCLENDQAQSAGASSTIEGTRWVMSVKSQGTGAVGVDNHTEFQGIRSTSSHYDKEIDIPGTQ
jgi:hypothetical protein